MIKPQAVIISLWIVGTLYVLTFAVCLFSGYALVAAGMMMVGSLFGIIVNAYALIRLLRKK